MAENTAGDSAEMCSDLRDFTQIPQARREQIAARIESLERERDVFRDRLAVSIEYVEGTPVGYGEDEIDRLHDKLSIATAQVESLAASVRQVRYELESTCLQKDFIAAKVRQLEAELDTKRWFINALNPQVHIDAFHDCYTIVVSHGISVPINSRTGPGVHDFAHHDSTPTLDAAIDAARKEKR